MDRFKKATKAGRREKEASTKKPTSSSSISVPGLHVKPPEDRATNTTVASAGTSPMSPTANVRYIQLDALLSPRTILSLDESSAVPSPRVRRLSMSRKGEESQVGHSIGAEISALEVQVDDLRERLRSPADQKDSATLSENLMAAMSKLSALRASEAETLTRTMSGYMAVTKRRAVARNDYTHLSTRTCLEFRTTPSGHDSKFWFSLTDQTLGYADSPEGPTLGRLTIGDTMAVTSIDTHRFTLASETQAWEFRVDSAEDHREWASALALAVGSGFISTPRRAPALSTSPHAAGATKLTSMKSPRGATVATRALTSPRGSQPPKEAPWSPPKRRQPKQGKPDDPQQDQLYRPNCDHAHYGALKAKLSPHFQVKIEEKLGLFKFLTGTLEDLCAWVITFSVHPYSDNLDFANFLLCRDFVCTARQLEAALESSWAVLNTRSASGSLPRKLHFVCRQWLEAPMVARDVEEEVAARKRFRLFCMEVSRDVDAYLAGSVIPSVDTRRDTALPLPSFELENSTEKSVNEVLRVVTAEELAEQLTLLAAEEFERVPTRDYLEYVRNSSSKLPKSLQGVADSFNKLSRWVTFSVVSKDTEKGRIAEFKRMLGTAEKLHALRNYHSAAAVLGGLGNTAITRLRKLQAAIGTKYTSRLLKLHQIYSPLRNYNSYRSLSMQAPCIPIMAIAMKDLLVTCESNPTYCSEEEVAINFTKLQMVGSILAEHQASRTYGTLYKNLKVAACLLSIEPATSQQLELEIQKLRASLAEAEDENRRLRAEACTHNALIAAARRLPTNSCSCAHATLLQSHLDSEL